MSKPVKKFHSGLIVASLWADNKVVNNEMVTVHTISIDKAYKVGDTWKYTKTFVPDDLLKVAEAAKAVYGYLEMYVQDLTSPLPEGHENSPAAPQSGDEPSR
jgi:hypothetical protein